MHHRLAVVAALALAGANLATADYPVVTPSSKHGVPVTSTSATYSAKPTETDSDCPADGTDSTIASYSAVHPTETDSDCPVETLSTMTYSAWHPPTETDDDCPAEETNSSSATDDKWTTSTIYTTKVYTVTSCHATVTNCPASHKPYVTTEVVPLTTTVCPVVDPPVSYAHQDPTAPLTTLTVVPTPSVSSYGTFETHPHPTSSADGFVVTAAAGRVEEVAVAVVGGVFVAVAALL